MTKRRGTVVRVPKGCCAMAGEMWKDSVTVAVVNGRVTTEWPTNCSFYEENAQACFALPHPTHRPQFGKPRSKTGLDDGEMLALDIVLVCFPFLWYTPWPEGNLGRRGFECPKHSLSWREVRTGTQARAEAWTLEESYSLSAFSAWLLLQPRTPSPEVALPPVGFAFPHQLLIKEASQ